MASRRLKLSIVGTVLVLAAVGFGLRQRARAKQRDDVTTYTVSRKTVQHTLQLAGRVVPVTSLVITPRQSGRVAAIAVQEGAQVKEGDLLFSMTLEAQGQTELLAQRSEVQRLELEVQAQNARLNEKRPVRELLGQAQISRDESTLEAQRLALRTAKDRLAVLEKDLGLSVKAKKSDKSANNGIVYVNAPSPGIVTLIDKRPGDFVLGGGAGDASASERMVMTIADMSSLLVRTRVLEADLRHVTKDLPVKVKIDAYPESSFTGVVRRIGGQGRVDTKGGYTYFDVDVGIDQMDARALPEMNTTIELILAKRENVLALPLNAVAIFPDRALVRVPDESKDEGYAEKTVKVGVVSETEAEIVEGLAENDKVLEIDFAALDLDGDGDGGGSGKDGKKRKKSGGGGRGGPKGLGGGKGRS